jgi:hypothetical protein
MTQSDRDEGSRELARGLGRRCDRASPTTKEDHQSHHEDNQAKEYADKEKEENAHHEQKDTYTLETIQRLIGPE